MESKSNRLYLWAIQKATSPRAPLWVGLLFFLELVLFMPLDALLIFFCLQDRRKISLYVAIAAVASLFSGVIGYLLGHFLWDLIGGYVTTHLISLAVFDRMSLNIKLYEHWAVFFGSLLPFPLKALSLSAGVFRIGIIPFSLCLVSARLLRFFLIGLSMFIWGEKMKVFVEKHFRSILMVIGAKVALIVFLFLIFAR